MNLTFRCKHINIGHSVWIKEPIVPVTLIGPTGEKLNFTAVLDSGSDLVLLPIEIAEALKLDFQKADQEKAKSYTGNIITTTMSKVRIRIQKSNQKLEFECRCAIWLDSEKQQENIIIGSSFFEHVRILFDYPNNRFQIKIPDRLNIFVKK